MASLILGAAGAGIGAAIGGSFLGMSAASIGWSLGSALGSALFQPSLPDINGPTLSDTEVQSNTYGNMREIRYGTNRMVCRNIIWSTKRIPTEHTETSGGKGAPSQSVTTTSYSVSFAVALGECGPAGIAGVRKIWLNKNLVLDKSASNTGFTGQSGNIRVYSGADTQLPSALMEAHLGAGNVPAYRGTPYIEFEDLQLADYGNQMPLVEAEVVEIGSETLGAVTTVTSNSFTPCINSRIYGNSVWAVKVVISGASDNTTSVGLLDITTGNVNVLFEKFESGTGLYYSPPCYIDFVMDGNVPVPVNELWFPPGPYGTYINIHDADSGQWKSQIASPFTWAGHIEFCEYLGLVFVASTNTQGLLYFYDPFTHALLFQLDGNSNGGMMFAHHRDSKYLFVTSNLGHVYVFDLDTKQLALDYTAAGTISTIGYDSKRGVCVVAANYSGSTSDFITIDQSLTVTVNSGISTPFPVTLLKYIPSEDIFLTLMTIVGSWSRHLIDPETFATLFSGGTGWVGPQENWAIDENNGSAMVWDGSSLSHVPYTTRLTPGIYYLYQAVADICGREGLTAGDIDVSQLTDVLPGYVIDRQMTGRAAIEGLQPAFYFDAVESD